MNLRVPPCRLQVPAPQRLQALAELMRLSEEHAAGRPYKPLPRMATAFVGAQVKVGLVTQCDCHALMLHCPVACVRDSTLAPPLAVPRARPHRLLASYTLATCRATSLSPPRLPPSFWLAAAPPAHTRESVMLNCYTQ